MNRKLTTAIATVIAAASVAVAIAPVASADNVLSPTGPGEITTVAPTDSGTITTARPQTIAFKIGRYHISNT